MSTRQIIDEQIKRFAEKNGVDHSLVRAERIGKGINAKVYTIANKAKKEIIKFYKKPSPEDKRNRQENEAKFLNYCELIGINYTPRLIDVNYRDSYTLLSFVAGKAPEYLGRNEIIKLVNFVSELNKPDNLKKQLEINNASERCDNPLRYAEELNMQLCNCKKIIKQRYQNHSNTTRTIDTRIQKVLSNTIKNIIENNEIKAWEDKKLNKMISPSDVGIHNMMKDGAKIYFIDFEYGGWDDVSKLCADIVLNPYHQKSEVNEHEIIRMLSSNNAGWGHMWLDRYISAKPLFAIKWCIILMKNSQRSTTDKMLANKINNYLDFNAPFL